MLWLLGETVAVAVAPFVDDKPVLGLSLLPSVLRAVFLRKPALRHNRAIVS